MGEEIKKEKVRKVFLEDLPRIIYRGRDCIDWKKSVGTHVRFVYEEIKGHVIITNYNVEKQLLEIEYNNKKINILAHSFLKGSLGAILNKVTSEFKIKIGQVFKDEKRDITITGREYRINQRGQKCKWYKYTCNKCGWTEGWIVESNLISKNQGCSCCCIYPQIVVENINSIVAKEETQWMIPYFQGGYDEAKLYTCQSNKKVYPICPDCGRIKDKPMLINGIYNNHSIGCECGDGISYPNKSMFNILTQLSIEFKTEYSPTWIKPKRYDFYIPSMNLIIEMDGGLGHGKRTHCKSNMTKEESKEIDDYKDKLAKEHNLEVVRIDCDYYTLVERFNFIKQNILNSKLSILLDLFKIDWLKCEEFALGNRVREVCDEWNTGLYETIKALSEKLKLCNSTIMNFLTIGTKLEWCNYENQINKRQRIKPEIINYYNKTNKGASKISKIFNIDVSVIRDYLHEGNDEGLCFYDFTKEQKLAVINTCKSRGKSIICINNGQEFESASDCARQSEGIFGVKLTQSCISQVCMGNQNNTKNYIFKFTKDLIEENQA